MSTWIIPGHLAPLYPPALAAEQRAALKAGGYTINHRFYSYGGDWPTPGTPASAKPAWHRPFSGYRSAADHDLIVASLQADISAGFQTGLWLRSDDDANPPSVALLKSTWPTLIPQIDPLVSCYVPGLESDEYWTWQQQTELVNLLASLTKKPILLHWRTGVWGPDGGERSWWDTVPVEERIGIAYQSRERPTEADWRNYEADVIIGRFRHLAIGGANSGNWVKGTKRICILGEVAPYVPIDTPKSHLDLTARRGGYWVQRGGQGAWDGYKAVA